MTAVRHSRYRPEAREVGRSETRAFRIIRMHVVADVGALHPEDDVFGDVGGVVGDSLQVAGHEQRIERLAHDFRAIVHGLDELNEGIVAHAVDHVVHFEDGLRQFGFAFNE